MRVTVLAGGIGGARFLLGLRELGHDITVIGNNGDDVTMFGLRICPDLDTVMYTLGGGISAERGWGREDESFRIREEFAAYGVEPTWFGLGDLDLATHVIRTMWRREGVPLSEITRRLCERWQPGVRLLPATDDDVETHVQLTDGRCIHFQEWWVRLQAKVAATGFDLVGADRAEPAAGVVEAVMSAEVIVLPPSNPIVSVGTILRIPGIAEAVRAASAPVVGVSPIIGAAPVRGMADACLQAIGVQTSAFAVAQHYGARPAGGLLDAWLVANEDAGSVSDISGLGISAGAAPLWMTDVPATAAMAQAALDLVS
jgi:LPPG:FO 2-phospho-L-lactate transferase